MLMSLQTPRRGRPKGSGIDDQKYLSDIAAMIAAKPDLKPTTAIKALGITDPSAIRRLRDKFHQFSATLGTGLGSAAGAGPIDGAPARVAPHMIEEQPAKAVGASPRSIAADVSRNDETLRALPEPSPVAAPVQAEAAPVVAAPRTAAPASPIDLFAMWCGLGLDVISTAMATQAAMSRSLTRLPHIDLALRQQLAFNELAMSLVPGRVVARTTLH